MSSRDNQPAETIKEINPAEIKVVIESVKTLRDGRVQIETGSVQEAETLTNCINDKLGDKIETHTKTTETKTENNQHSGRNFHRQHRGHQK